MAATQAIPPITVRSAAAERAVLLVADPDTATIVVRPAVDAAGLPVTIPAAAFDRLAAATGRTVAMSPVIAAVARALAAGARDDALGGTYAQAKAVELVCELVAMLGRERGPDDRGLSAAMRMIDEGWRDGPTIAVLARACGLNREKLTRGFRDRYGCTVGEALAERRLRHAEALLADTDLAVGTIGYRSGYRNEASFCRAFRRRFGLPPMAFRKERIPA